MFGQHTRVVLDWAQGLSLGVSSALVTAMAPMCGQWEKVRLEQASQRGHPHWAGSPLPSYARALNLGMFHLNSYVSSFAKSRQERLLFWVVVGSGENTFQGPNE